MQRRSFFKLGIGSVVASTLSPALSSGRSAQNNCEFSGSSAY